MNGVPADLDLTFFHGAEVIQVCLGQYQLQIHFQPAGAIFIEGGWELLDAAGERIDRSYDAPERPPYQLHRLLGRRVVGSEVAAPISFALRFDGGDLLRVFDDSEQFESFHIQPGDNIV